MRYCVTVGGVQAVFELDEASAIQALQRISVDAPQPAPALSQIYLCGSRSRTAVPEVSCAFGEEAAAVKACTQPEHFVCPVPFNVTNFPAAAMPWAGLYFPLAPR